jgi:predicted ArsR family transcriptional regulator
VASPEERDGWAVSTSDDRARLQRQARALANPTRFAIFEQVAEAPLPVRVAELVEQFGLNHNVIRQHLAKLCEAHLLTEEFATRSGPGRPALQYRVTPEAEGRWGVSSPCQQLAALLLEMAAENLSPRDAGRRAGREAAAGTDLERATPLEHLMAELQRQGLEPQSVYNSGGVEVVLNSCPLPEAAEKHRTFLCEIHRGLAEGFLEAVGSDLEVRGMQIGQPPAAPCTIRLGTARTVRG